MNIFSNFYRKTHYFWVSIRGLFILVLVLNILNPQQGMSNGLVILFKVVYCTSLGLIFYNELFKKNVPKFLKVFTGVASILIGIIFTYIFLSSVLYKYEIEKDIVVFIEGLALIFIVAILFILFGLWDLNLKLQNKFE